jgi:DNA-binding MarR family transcriptional regulator
MGSHISGEARNPTRRVLDSIRRIVQFLRESSREAETLGLSGAQLFVLRTAADSPGLSVGALAERTRTHQSSVSVVVARLVEQGLLERTTAADDSRRAEVRLTPDGLQRIRSAPPTAQERLVAAVDALPKASRSRLASVLDALVQELALGSTHPEMFFQDSEERARKARLANV